MSAPVKLVCKKCGTDECLWREVMIPGWEGIEAALQADGKIVEAETGEHGTDTGIAAAEPGNEYGCSKCGQTSCRLSDIVRPIFAVGQRVFLPSGATGYVETIDGNTITVDDVEYASGILEPWEPHPGQLAIEAA